MSIIIAVEYLARADCQPLLVSTVGADNNGRNIIRNMKELNMVRGERGREAYSLFNSPLKV